MATLLVPPRVLPVSMTAAANARPSVDARVLRREGVTAKALGLYGVSSANRFPTELVHLRRDRLQVTRIYATADAAQVVNLKPLRDRPDKVLIGPSVRGDVQAFPNLEPSVPITASPRQPQPTGVGEVNLLEKPLLNRSHLPVDTGACYGAVSPKPALDQSDRGVERRITTVTPPLNIPRPSPLPQDATPVAGYSLQVNCSGSVATWQT